MKIIAALLTVALAPALAPRALAQAAAPEPVSSTRLFVMPTGHTLPGSSGYLDVISLGVAQFQAGATDWFSFGAGTPSLVFGGDRPVWVTPKVALARGRRANAAAGTVHVFSSGGSGGFGYAAVTVGQRATSLTLGVMQGYGDVPDAVRALLVGVEHRRSGHTRLMVEASVFRSGGLVIAGVRRVHRHFTSDFGMAVPIAADSPVVAFPVINFGWRF